MFKMQSTITLTAAALLSIQAAASGLSFGYVEKSAGLAYPGMEGGSTELEFGDVNGDGHVDLVCVGDHGSPYVGTDQHGVMVWFGDGAGNWSVFQYGNFGYGGIALGDVDNDGLIDVGYGVHHDYSGEDLGDQILEVALGDGSGQYWEAWDDGLATNGETWGMFGTDFADVDNDGDLDVGSASFGCCAGLHVYLNEGDGSWTQSWGFIGGNSDMVFVFGDVNGDGHADLAASHGDGVVYIGDGQGNFTSEDGDLPGPDWKRGVALGDVNGDGRDELSFGSDTGIAVFTWISPGHWEDLSGDLAYVGRPGLTEIADMNLDGHGDIVALYDTSTDVYLGDGQGNWQLAATISKPDACDTAALRAGTDFDHNGYPDFAFVVEDDCGWVGGTNTLLAYAESSTPAAASIHPSYPRGGETFIAGSVRFIDWHAAVPDGVGWPTVTAALSLDGPDGAFQAIASDAPNNGRIQWSVPPGTQTSEDCYIRLTLNTDPPVTVITPGAFTIVSSGEPIPGDANGDGLVDIDDIFAILAAWGPCDACLEDVNDDGVVDIDDIFEVLANWT